MTDRLDRLERHLSEVLAGPRRLMRSLSKTAIGTYAMTAQNETVAAVLADLKILVDSDALESVYARLESALTKAEAVDPVATVCFRGDRYASGNMIEVQLQIVPGTELPIGTKLYAHAPPAAPVESQQADAKDAARFRWLRDHAINTEGRKGSPWCVYGLDLGDCTPTFGAELVAFVDDAMTNGIVCSPVPVESLGRAAPIESPASVPDGWLPIETAPKDGTFVLVYEPGWDHEQMDQEIARYNSSSGKWVWAHAGMSMNPTHWKSLPAPPTNQEGAAP